MVRHYKRKVGTRSYKDYSADNLKKAILACKNDGLSIRKACESYGVYGKSKRRMKSQSRRRMTRQSKRKMTRQRKQAAPGNQHQNILTLILKMKPVVMIPILIQ